MLTSIRQSARRACAAAGRNIFAETAISRHVRPGFAVAELAVHMLVSSRTWHAGLLAAASLEYHSGRRWQFFVHDDGTVDGHAQQRIRQVFDDAVIVGRTEADARAREFFEAHPKCLKHRGQHNLFLKFSDFVAWTPGKRFIVMDSDVIFFRRPQEILDWVDSSADKFHYNQDTKEKYCVPRCMLEDQLELGMWPLFNSGLILVPCKSVSRDLAEKVLVAFEGNAHHPQFFEQTLYAVMGSAWGRGGVLPERYEISWGYFRRPGAVCRHYVGAFKHDLLYIEGATRLWWDTCVAHRRPASP
jgi:hypothetical protein